MGWKPLVWDFNERTDQSNLTSPTMAAGDVGKRMTFWGDRGQYGAVLSARYSYSSRRNRISGTFQCDARSLHEDGSFHASLVLEL